MNGFASWAMTILGVIIVAAILDMILPQGRMSKFLRSIFATLTVLIIVTPLPSLFKNEFSSIGDFFSGNGIELNEHYLDYTKNSQAKVYEDALGSVLKTDGYSGFNVSVTLNDDMSIKAVVINFSNSGINDNNAHINKNELIKKTAQYLVISEDRVLIL